MTAQAIDFPVIGLHDSEVHQFVVPARLPKPVLGLGGLSSSRFDDDVRARRRLHMNSIVLAESQGGSCAFGRIVRLQKFDRRDNMLFTVHLNRLISENTPLEQSTIETCLQEAYKYQKVAKISCDIGAMFEASWLDCVTMMSKMTIAVIVVSATCHHLTRADSGWSRISWFSHVTLHDCEVAPVWHNDVTNARTHQFFRCLTVFPFEFRPRTFTIGFYGKRSFISEIMILECSFPLRTRFSNLANYAGPAELVSVQFNLKVFVPKKSVQGWRVCFKMVSARSWSNFQRPCRTSKLTISFGSNLLLITLKVEPMFYRSALLLYFCENLSVCGDSFHQKVQRNRVCF